MNNIYNLKLISELNGKARVEIVNGTVHPTTGEANVLYLVKPTGASNYDQWVCAVGGTTETPTYTWTKVGNDVDLSGYLKKTDAPGYNDILTQTSAASTYRTIADSYTKTEVDTALSAKLDSTTAASTYRTIADSYTKTEVDTAVSGVSTRVTAIEGVIPGEASAENQLADKDFVNSSIATSTATFRGSWRLVEDLELTVADANDEKKIATALKAKMDAHVPPIEPDDNDYAYVIIPAHEIEGVHYEARFDRYKFGAWTEETTTYYWSYEFSLNNSSFTAAQWAAINSGATSTKISGYDTHVADTDIHVTAADKTSWNAKLDATTAASTYRTIADSYTKTEVDTALSAKLDTTTAASTYVTQTEYEGTQFTTSKAINELQTAVSGKLDTTTAASTYRTIADSYTKTQVDTAVNAKLDSTTAASTYRTIADSYTKTQVDTAVGAKLDSTTAASTYRTIADSYTKTEVDTAVNAKLDSTTAASTYRTIADSYTKTEVDTALSAKLDSTTAASTYRTIADAEDAEMVAAKAINRHETLISTCVKNGDGSITLHDNTGDVVITAQLLRELLSLIEKNS